MVLTKNGEFYVPFAWIASYCVFYSNIWCSDVHFDSFYPDVLGT